MSQQIFFTAWDYVMIALMLVISSGIGVYFSLSGGKQKTMNEFLLAGKNMAVLPVAFSIMASFMSAISVIGTPSEMYMYGFGMAYFNVGSILGTIFAAYLALPIFFDLQGASVNQYLEMRFGKLTRVMASIAFTAQMILFMSVVLYAPALAMSAISGLSNWLSIATVGLVCTFYCTIGGMKAVIWTDVFQAILMFLAVISVIIKGSIDVGGFGKVFTIAKEGGRLEHPPFIFDLTTRVTFWNMFFAATIMTLGAVGTNQIAIQRMLTVNTIRKARASMYIGVALAIGFALLTSWSGLVLYANYHDCDPVTFEGNVVSSPDQLMPFFIMESFADYPCLPGICVAGIFSASLSTVSSAVNSLTAITIEDFLRTLCSLDRLSETKATILAKGLAFSYGCIFMLLTVIASSFSSVIHAALTLFGILAGPVLSVFTLGMFTTRGNQKGAISGLILGIAFISWIAFGAGTVQLPDPRLPVSLEGCPVYNSTTFPYSNSSENIDQLEMFESNFTQEVNSTEILIETNPEIDYSNIFPLYRLSFIWYSFAGWLVSSVIGYITSVITGGNETEVKPELITPFLRWFYFRKEQKNQIYEMKEKEAKEKSVDFQEKPVVWITNNEKNASY